MNLDLPKMKVYQDKFHSKPNIGTYRYWYCHMEGTGVWFIRLEYAGKGFQGGWSRFPGTRAPKNFEDFTEVEINQ